MHTEFIATNGNDISCCNSKSCNFRSRKYDATSNLTEVLDLQFTEISQFALVALFIRKHVNNELNYF